MVPNHPRYQLRYTRIFSFLLSVVVVKDVVKRLFSEFLGKMQSAKMPVFARDCGISDFARMPGGVTRSQTTRAPSCATPGYLLNFSQLWDKLWSKRVLTEILIFANDRNPHEYRGFEAFCFQDIKRPTRSQTKHSTKLSYTSKQHLIL